MAYPALQKRVKDGPITVQDMVDFYAEYIQCDALGMYDVVNSIYTAISIKVNFSQIYIYANIFHIRVQGLCWISQPSCSIQLECGKT